MIHASLHKENKQLLHVFFCRNCRYLYNDKFNKSFVKFLKDIVKHMIKI